MIFVNLKKAQGKISSINFTTYMKSFLVSYLYVFLIGAKENRFILRYGKQICSDWCVIFLHCKSVVLNELYLVCNIVLLSERVDDFYSIILMNTLFIELIL